MVGGVSFFLWFFRGPTLAESRHNLCGRRTVGGSSQVVQTIAWGAECWRPGVRLGELPRLASENFWEF
jgi:hypothetical protein